MFNRLLMPLFLVAVLGGNLIAVGQTREEKKYALRAKEVDDEVMGTPDAFFTDNTVPASYSNSSAVILAKKTELFADLKSKMRFSLFYGKDVTNTIRYALTIREKIRIQDKNALDEFSEYTFSKITRQSSFFSKSANTFVGITLIKPDGTRKKIDVDEEAVNTGSDDERNKYKLAIPGLQVGDIIDLYSRVEKESSSDNPVDPVAITMGGSYPIVHYSFNCRLRKDFAVIYTSNNGAPDLQETRDNEFMYLKMDFKDVPRTPGDLWLYDKRELPVFRINILPGASEKAIRASMPTKGKVVKGLSREWIGTDIGEKMAGISSGNTNEMLVLAKDNLKKMKKDKAWKDNKDSLINYFYYYGRFLNLYDYMSEEKLQVGLERNYASTDYNFFNYLIAAFKSFDIDYDLIVTVPRTEGTIYDAVSTDDFLYLLRAKGNSDYYLFPPHMYSIINSLPSLFEGQEAYVFPSTSLLHAGAKFTTEKLPYTRATFNNTTEQMEISLNAANPMQLDVIRTKSISGNPAYENQCNLTLFEEYVDAERVRFGERNFKDEIMARMGKKRGEQLLGEYGQAFAEARRNREELAKEEVINNLEQKPVSFTDFKVLQTGNRNDQRVFSFQEKFTLDGLVKKAGPNYILTIGNLFPGQVQVTKDQRERKNNIYMPYARSFDIVITLTIPQGYTVEGLEALNKKVENETGGLTSKATMVNGKLVLTVSKVYQHYYETIANWPRMLDFLDAAYDLSQQKLLIKKI